MCKIQYIVIFYANHSLNWIDKRWHWKKAIFSPKLTQKMLLRINSQNVCPFKFILLINETSPCLIFRFWLFKSSAILFKNTSFYVKIAFLKRCLELNGFCLDIEHCTNWTVLNMLLDFVESPWKWKLGPFIVA